jgi:hypothetical protein
MSQTIEEILKADPNVIRIEPAEDFDIPSLDELSDEFSEKLKSEKRCNHKYHYKKLIELLEAPYIIDNFPSTTEGHYERSDWKHIFYADQPEVETFLQNNALREAYTLLVEMGCEALQEQYTGKNKETFTTLTQSCIDYFRNEMKDYDEKPRETKVEMVKEFKQRAYKVLQHLRKS